MDQAAQIKSLVEDKIPLIKNFDQEIRDLIKVKSEADGEIRTLKKRISDQDEQIGNLHQSSASKQQALAIANQRLSELERRGKQDGEASKLELEKLKAELSRVTMESEAQSQTSEQVKNSLESELDRMRSEAGQIKDEVEAVYQSISAELKESHQRQAELEAELNSSKDVNQLLKNQLADLRAYHEKQGLMNNNAKGGVAQNGLMVINHKNDAQAGLDWKPHTNNSPSRFVPCYQQRSTSSPSEEGDSLRPQDSSDEMIDFVTSNIPLTHSIHAPQPTTTNRHPSSAFFQQHADMPRSSSSRLSTGTVTSFIPPLQQQPSASQPAAVAKLAQIHRNLGSPTPSRASVASRLTLDQDGWWSSQDY